MATNTLKEPWRSLAAQLKPGQLVTDPVELITYEIDAAIDRGHPQAVAFPHTREEVVKIVRWAAENGVPLVARGAGTGLSGGAVAERGGLILAFTKMDRIREFDPAGRSAVVEMGVVNLRLDEAVKKGGLYFPPDPASGRSATLGGNIAENAGGPHCFKYGVTTNYLTGLEVVLADGRTVRLGGRASDYPEYDFIALLTGSEGTLGVLTEASVRLLRNPPAVKTMMAAFDTVAAAGEAVSALIGRGLTPATMEFMDQKMMGIIEAYAHAGLPVEAGAALIVEVDGYPESLTPQMDEIVEILGAHGAWNVQVAQTAEERERIWYGRKSAAGAMARLSPAYYLLDGTVPRSKLAATLEGINGLCDRLGLRVGYVFHAGDGNLHPFILIPDPGDKGLMARVFAAGEEIMELCVRQDGSITGEHGVGIEKRRFMPRMYSPAELGAMLDVKAVFDPQGLLNPGKIFPEMEARPAVAGPAGVGPASPFRPGSTAEAAAGLRAWMAAGKRVRLRGSGAQSSLLADEECVLSTEGLDGICAYAPQDLYVTVGAGMPLAALQARLAEEGMWAPLAAPWPDATVGGLIATNCNGPLRMRYGGLRDLLLAARVVLPDGRTIRVGRPVVKNVAGYDLPKLFAGSYGTLGLITEATLKLAPVPRRRASLVVPVGDLEQGLDWGRRLLPVCLNASALLLCRVPDGRLGAAPYSLIYTVEGMAEDVAAELDQAGCVLRAAGAAESNAVEALAGSQVWADWIGAGPRQPGEGGGTGYLARAGVAAKDLPAFVLGVGLEEDSFIADLASGLLYFQGCAGPGGLAGRLAAWRAAAGRLGGYTVLLAASGPVEGVDPWGYTPDSLDLMRRLKARWDPGGQLNPGAFLV